MNMREVFVGTVDRVGREVGGESGQQSGGYMRNCRKYKYK